MPVTVGCIAEFIEELAPCDLAVESDNVGLLIGRSSQMVTKILLALDATEEVVNEAIEKECHMIVTHHPLFKKQLCQINDSSVLGIKILKLVENKIALYTAHTNLDKADGGVNDHLCNILGLKDVKVLKDEKGANSFLRIGNLAKPTAFSLLAKEYAQKLSLPYLPAVGPNDKLISCVGVVGGSGISELSKALKQNVDLFITGDIKYHDACNALENGLCLLDITHYGGEVPIIKELARYLETKRKESGAFFEIIVSEINAQPFKLM